MYVRVKTGDKCSAVRMGCLAGLKGKSTGYETLNKDTVLTVKCLALKGNILTVNIG